jgi:hypothetical protein
MAESRTRPSAAAYFIGLRSYNQAVSNRRLRFASAAALAACLAIAVPSAQTPTLDEVLKRTASYVADFRRQLSGIVAEETYRQEIVYTGRVTNQAALVNPRRRLTSDLLLVKAGDADRYVELRDVLEVDGVPLHNRQGRLEELLRARTTSAEVQIQQIIEESARYNIGKISRNLNTPLMALQFLDTTHQSRFEFKHVPKAKPVFTDAADQVINEAAVFRVSTEMWTIEYREKGRNTIVRNPSGGRMPAHGRFWINPTNGSVLISELIVDGSGVIATVTVSYQSEPLMGFLVPVEMRESYVGYGERITGHAEYGKFRELK